MMTSLAYGIGGLMIAEMETMDVWLDMMDDIFVRGTKAVDRDRLDRNTGKAPTTINGPGR